MPSRTTSLLAACLLASLVCLGAWLTGCASTVPSLQRATATSVGRVPPEHVRVSNVQRSATRVSWDSVTPQGRYRCQADDMVRRVHCVEE
jgi:hypothetical protein